MAYYKEEAIILGSFQKSGEADKILTLFGRQSGKTSAIAKGARRTTSKFGGRLEIFSFNNFMLASGRNLDIVSQCETIENFKNIREDLDSFHTASYLIKTINDHTEKGQRNEKLFDLLLESLRELKNGAAAHTVIARFDVQMAKVEGLFPVLDQCAKCAKKIIKHPKAVRFSFKSGGILCKACSGIDADQFIVQFHTLVLAQKLLENNTFDPGKADASAISRLFKTYLNYHFGKDILYEPPLL